MLRVTGFVQVRSRARPRCSSGPALPTGRRERPPASPRAPEASRRRESGRSRRDVRDLPARVLGEIATPAGVGGKEFDRSSSQRGSPSVGRVSGVGSARRLGQRRRQPVVIEGGTFLLRLGVHHHELMAVLHESAIPEVTGVLEEGRVPESRGQALVAHAKAIGALVIPPSSLCSHHSGGEKSQTKQQPGIARMYLHHGGPLIQGLLRYLRPTRPGPDSA